MPLPEDLSCKGMDARTAKAWRADLVDSSVNRALDALRTRGRPCSFPRGWVRHAFHDMTLVGRASYLVAKTQTSWGWRLLRRLGRIFTESFVSMRDELCNSRPEIDEAVRVCLEHGALGTYCGWRLRGCCHGTCPDRTPGGGGPGGGDELRRGWRGPAFLPMTAGFAASQRLVGGD